jgi:formate hydrogenlyase subunit 3/multisubunit Na+/H+ antiporter MnhD subunit
MLGVYALARLFPSEPALIYVGAAMMVLGAFYAAAEDDLRRAGAYAITAQTGLCVALIGVGTPLALAAAEGHAFAAILAFMALQLVLGAVLERFGSVRVSQLAGAGRVMPVSGLLLLGCGVAVSAAPGLALYATHAVALEAVAQWDLRWLWTLVWVLPAVVFVGLMLRAALAAFAPPAQSRPINEAPFAMLLGAGLALFLCFAVGLAPRWLYNLMPADLIFQPFAIDRVAPQFEILGAAGISYLVLWSLRVAPRELGLRLLDIDALYRGPLADAGRWAGVLALRVYGAWQSWTRTSSDRFVRGLGALASACDRPYVRGNAGAAFLACVAAALLIMFLVH